MNIKLLSFFVPILILIMPSACGPSQAQQVATVTQVAGIVYSTETALAPTSTQTFTPTPTPTVTPTPTATATSTLTPTPTITPTPTLDPSVLFFDDFSGPNTGWDEYSDADVTKGYTGGGYSIATNKTGYCYWSVASRTYSNITIDVDAQKLNGTVNNEYGVVCRYKDNKNFHYLTITSDGYYQIGKLTNGNWVKLGSAESGFNDSVIKSGTDINHLQVTCNEDVFSLSVNGTDLATITDPGISNGDVGLFVCAYAKPGVEILFDNFLVVKQ